jgi:hypothetical protein
VATGTTSRFSVVSSSSAQQGKDAGTKGSQGAQSAWAGPATHDPSHRSLFAGFTGESVARNQSHAGGDGGGGGHGAAEDGDADAVSDSGHAGGGVGGHAGAKSSASGSQEERLGVVLMQGGGNEHEGTSMSNQNPNHDHDDSLTQQVMNGDSVQNVSGESHGMSFSIRTPGMSHTTPKLSHMPSMSNLGSGGTPSLLHLGETTPTNSFIGLVADTPSNFSLQPAQIMNGITGQMHYGDGDGGSGGQEQNNLSSGEGKIIENAVATVKVCLASPNLESGQPHPSPIPPLPSPLFMSPILGPRGSGTMEAIHRPDQSDT